MNNKKNSTRLTFELSLPAHSEPNRITAMAIRGAPHFSPKIYFFRRTFRCRVPAWQRIRTRFARALTRPSDQQPQPYRAKHYAKDLVRFLSAYKTRNRRWIASLARPLIEKNPLIGNGGQGQ